jgi:hypothetical protein
MLQSADFFSHSEREKERAREREVTTTWKCFLSVFVDLKVMTRVEV